MKHASKQEPAKTLKSVSVLLMKVEAHGSAVSPWIPQTAR